MRAAAVRSQRGIALIIVLIGLSLLLTVAAEFALAMRLEATTTLNFRAAVAAAYLAEAGYHRAAAEILADSLAQYLDHGVLVFRRARNEIREAPKRDGLALGPGRFGYRIDDEEARLNLNRTTPEQLHRLLTELGVTKEERDVIVDSIQDWRDANDEHRLNGAESDYYLALPAPYRAKNADFDSVEELLQVRGVTPQLFDGTPDRPGLGAYLTVGGLGRLNINTASDVLLRALGFAQAEVDFLEAGRPYLDLAGIPAQFRARAVPFTVSSTTFRVEATGELPGQGRRTLVVLAQKQTSRNGLVQLTPRSWRWADGEPRQP